VFDQGRPPEFLGLPTETLSETLRALTLLRADDVTGAAAIVMGIEETRRRNPGKTGDKSFADVRDLDDLLAPVLEVLTSTGKYFWVSWDNIELLEFKKPERPRDLLWRPAHIIVRGGPDGAVYVPAIYEQTPALGDDQLRLGRSTDWRELTHGLVRGLGQRTLLVGEHDTPILECGVFEFTDAQPVNGRAEV
jgi:type VI secretion system protein ImpE